MDKRLKVVWLCHFSNAEIQNAMGLEYDGKEVAPWIPMAIKTVEGFKDIDLYVVFEYNRIRGIKHFDLRGVHYTAVSFPHSLLFRLLHNKFFCSSRYHKAKRIISAVVDEIKPDVVHCFGAECGEISATFLPLIKKYPSILSVQGFIYKTLMKKRGSIKSRIEIEKQILTSIKVAFTESKVQGTDIKAFNPQIKLYWHTYGSYEIKPSLPRPGIKYDLVFFARLQRDKGLYDLLDAVSIIKREKENISLCVIGGGDVEEFRSYAESIGVNKNVEFTGFLPTRQDVFNKAQEGLISVLPTYNDINPGTIIESMFLEIPVVSYDVDTNPEVNEKGEALKLVPKGDVKSLANAIIQLLDHEDERNRQAKKARQRAYEMYAPSNEYLRRCLMEGYRYAISIFGYNTNK